MSAADARITVYIVPVYDGRLLVFDVQAREARGRWLPWDALGFGGNPYEAASALADDWCDGAISDLTLADVMSFTLPGFDWEVALIFRAELDRLPAGDDARTPFLFPAGEFDAVGSFDPADLERWVAAGARRAGGQRLVF